MPKNRLEAFSDGVIAIVITLTGAGNSRSTVRLCRRPGSSPQSSTRPDAELRCGCHQFPRLRGLVGLPPRAAPRSAPCGSRFLLGKQPVPPLACLFPFSYSVAWATSDSTGRRRALRFSVQSHGFFVLVHALVSLATR